MFRQQAQHSRWLHSDRVIDIKGEYRMNKPILVSVLTLVLGLAGCVSTGHDFNMADVGSLTPGVSTLDDAVAKFGKPTSVTFGPHGGQIDDWTYSYAAMGGAGGKSVALLFDKDKRFVQVMYKTELSN